MKKYFALIMILIILLVGCEGQQSEVTDTGATSAAFIGGDIGLDMKFIQGAPPVEVYDKGFPFNINVMVQNAGEYDISSGEARIRVVGIVPGDFGNPILEKSNLQDLRGASLDPQSNTIDGGLEAVEFSNLQASPVKGSVPYKIRAEACYPYGTNVVTQICILDDLLGTTRKGGETPFCEVNEIKEVENSGAPVKIANFKQTATGKDKITFSFDVVHVGEGTIFKKGNMCVPDVANKNKAYVKVDTGITGGSLTCNGLNSGAEGEITLYGNAGSEKMSIFCVQTLPVRADSNKQINLELEYNYQQHIDTELIVKHTE